MPDNYPLGCDCGNIPGWRNEDVDYDNAEERCYEEAMNPEAWAAYFNLPQDYTMADLVAELMDTPEGDKLRDKVCAWLMKKEGYDG